MSAIIQIQNLMSSTSIIDSISNPFNKPNRKTTHQSNPFAKLRQLLLPGKKPIDLRSRPKVPISAYQYVPFQSRKTVYRDEEGNFFLQSFQLVSEPVCVTYCHGTTNQLVTDSHITKKDISTLHEQIPSFNEYHDYTILKKLPVEDFETTGDTVLFVPVGSNLPPDFLASKDDLGFSNFVKKQTPCTHTHLKNKDKKV